jgi:hypothetical protein
MQKRLFIPIFLLLLLSCNKSKLPLEFPTQYDGSNFVANTYDQYALRLQYNALVNEAQKGRDSGVVVLYSDLSNLFNIGNPSLKNSASAYFATQMDTTLGWLKDLAQSSGLKYIPGTSSTKGGFYHGYLFNEKGLELQQLIEKGLLNASFFHTATQLMSDGVTLEESDQILALFGAHPDFPNTPTLGKANNPDELMAKYAAQRDQNNQTGFYSAIKEAFIRLQTSIKAGNKYQQDQEKAAKDICLLWEKISYATVIHSCQKFTQIMSQSFVQENDRAKALHHYAEAVGLIYGWRTLNKSYKRFSDPEIDLLLSQLRVAPNVQAQSYLFIVDPYNAFPNIYQVEQAIQTKFQFTQKEMEDFKSDWVFEQGR